ncbi:MAG: (Fe-S)-binding protein [Planctomycetota bacterium]|jgi:L-lactate dehydrogenase complex protein LldE
MKVSLFVTCLTDTFYPRVGEAVVRVLEKLGCELDFPAAQTCCGQPMFNTGCHDEARKLARNLITVFEDSEVVVSPSGSCCAMIREYYAHELFKDDPHWRGRAETLAAKTYEFAEFLLNVLRVDLKELGCVWPGEEAAVKTTYHYSCHLRGLGMTDEAVRLLSMIRGVDYVPLVKSEQCCGFGGTFAVKYPEISGSMVADKVSCVSDTGADVLVCNDGGCALNIEGALRRNGKAVTTKHIAQIIAEGLGLMPVQTEGAPQ